MSKIQSAGSVAGKEIVYVDVDDEITAIIDKVQSAKGKVVALVLPKRATVLQSIVNMKLLKHTADNAAKNLVLVTSEAGLMPLAGGVGLHVASTPNSRPEIPPAPTGPDNGMEDADEPFSITDGSADEEAADFDPKKASAKTVGELATASASGTAAAASQIDEDIDMTDDADEVPEAATPAAVKKNRKLAVPNFESFRKKIAIGVLALVLLITGYIFAFIVLPKATVTISTDSSTIATNQNLVLDTTAKALDTSNGIIPAVALSQPKTDTQQVPATGQVNNGDKATGNVSMTAQKCSGNLFTAPDDVPAGTSITSAGHTYILQDNASFHGVSTSGGCGNYASNSKVSITALRGGAEYNITSAANFTVTGRSDVTANGTATGGTDNISKIVAQADIDGATAKIKAGDSNSVKQQLISALQAKGLQAISSTFLAGDPQVTTSAKAGDTADSVTVTAVTPYTMLAVKKSDLVTIVDTNVDKQIDKSRQVILDDGIANAKFTQQSPGTATGANVAMEAKSVAGPHIDLEQLKTKIAGMKSGDVKNLVKQTPGVTDVRVKYSPFWVSSVPKKATKITITIDKAGA